MTNKGLPLTSSRSRRCSTLGGDVVVLRLEAGVKPAAGGAGGLNRLRVGLDVADALGLGPSERERGEAVVIGDESLRGVDAEGVEKRPADLVQRFAELAPLCLVIVVVASPDRCDDGIDPGALRPFQGS